jgi:hypothetical protein
MADTNDKGTTEAGSDLIRDRGDGFYEVEGVQGYFNEETARRVARNVSLGRATDDQNARVNRHLGG